MATEYNEIEVKSTTPISEEEYQKMNKKTVQKDIRKVATAKVKKRNLLTRVIGSLTPEGGFKSVGNYITHDILIPTVKDMMFSAGMSILSSVLHHDNYNYYGHAGKPSSWSNPMGRQSSKTNYTNYQNRGRKSNTNYAPDDDYAYVKELIITEEDPNGRINHVQSIASANEVLHILEREIQRNGKVCISDYYYAAGAEIRASFTDEQYGWTNLRGARVVQVRDGAKILLPEPEYIGV